MLRVVLKGLISIGLVFVVSGCGGGGGTASGASTATTGLSEELKDSITYMFNEERLAKDVYLAINAVQPVGQLYNIATNSETQHIDQVDQLAVKYDLNVSTYDPTLDPYEAIRTPGKYNVQHVQDLYDMLYTKGIKSKQDALEVGCMVEVVDINDLDAYIAQAQASNAQDIEAVFIQLRNGSYNHYWSFDQALKELSIPVAEGCCILGTEYCHPEYPKK